MENAVADAPPLQASLRRVADVLATAAREWSRNVAATLEILAAHRPLRIAVLLAANAICMPYGNLFHDAQLYALQVMNRVSNGAFANDLFLRFGSHDQYTPFARLAAPVAALMGIDWAFFVFFLGFNTLLIIAIERLVEALIDDRGLRTLAQLLVVTTPLPYGGLGVFRVQEYFFTPRTIASALALFALTATVRRRYLVAFALAGAGTLIHPLMGFAAVLIVLICAAVERLPRRGAVALLALAMALGLATAASRPLGDAMFGTMDPEWLVTIREASAYTLLGGWAVSDWVRTLSAFALVSSAAFVLRREYPQRAWLLLAAAYAAAAGLVATAVAAHLSYRLLIQAQPYRAVWIVHALQIPAAFLVAQKAWKYGGRGRVVAVLVLGLVTITDFTVYEILFPLSVFAVLLILQRRLHLPQRAESVAVGVAVSLSIGFVAWSLLKVSFVITRAHDFLQVLDATSYARKLIACLPSFLWLGVVLTCLFSCLQRRRDHGAAILAAIAIAMAVHVVAFTLNESRALRARFDPSGADVDFARHYVRDRYASAPRPPTVYAGAWGDSGYVWFDLHAQSYFGAVVVIFSRDTALETRRRAEIVRPFELERYRHAGTLPEVFRRMVDYLWAPERGASPPTTSDLLRLCRVEEGVDVAVLSQRLSHLASVENGHVFIYECDRVLAHAHALTSR